MDNIWEKSKKLLSGHPTFRLKQILNYLYFSFIENWEEATSLPKELREELEKNFSLEIKAEIFSAKDGKTQKGLLTLSDGEKIECVLMRHEDGRNTICVSTQAGCPMGCKFCATGKLGFRRNLHFSEIVEQVLFFSRLLKKEKLTVNNVVFMGMGEPMLNFENVLAAIEVLNDKNCFNIGARKISVSTCGIVSGIDKLAQCPLQINLAISLHAPNDLLRNKLMPVNKNFDLKKLFAALRRYLAKTGRKLMIEYILLREINDTPKCAEELASVLKRELKRLFMVNLISYNETGEYTAPSRERIKLFKEILRKNDIEVTERVRFGHDIAGACGQLAAKNADF